MWMVIYAHPLCTYILLMCTLLALETFSTNVWMFLAGQAHNRVILRHKLQQPAQTETNKDHSRPSPQAQLCHRDPQGLTCPLCAPWPAERAAARQAAGRLAGRKAMGQAGSIDSTLLYLVLICISARMLKRENPM